MRPSSSSSNLMRSRGVRRKAIAASLPEDLIFDEILAKLPIKSLMRFKCVSKTWMTRISDDSYFIDAHRRQQQSHDDQLGILLYGAYREEPERQRVTVLSEQCSKAKEVEVSYLDAEISHIIASCNGLVCLSYKGFPGRFVLWNPATRQQRRLPSPVETNDILMWGAGFGFDEASRDYKVVFLSSEYTGTEDQPSLCSHVFARNGTAWRTGGDSGIKGIPLMVWTQPVEADGALHWRLSRGRCGGFGSGIMSFDLSGETLRYADGPSGGRFNICRWKSSLVAYTQDRDNGSVYVHVGSSSSGAELRWIKTLKFTLGMEEQLIYIWREQFVMMLYDRDLMLRPVDPEARGTLKKLDQNSPFDIFPFLCDYVDTIASVY